MTAALKPPISTFALILNSPAWSEDASAAENLVAKASQEDRSISLGVKRRHALAFLDEQCASASVPDWDGYGAVPVDSLAMRYAREFLHKLPTDLPYPDIGVDPDGEISFEWGDDPKWMFSVSVGRDGTLTYAGLFGINHTHGVETYSKTIPMAIEGGIRRTQL